MPPNDKVGITGIVGTPGMTGIVGTVATGTPAAVVTATGEGALKPLSTDANGTALAPAGNGD